MSFSAGVFSINSTGQPVVTGTVISSTVFNALTADLASGLTTCVLKDGTQTITGNIPMATYKFTGLGAGSAAGNSVRFEQLLTFAANVAAHATTSDVWVAREVTLTGGAVTFTDIADAPAAGATVWVKQNAAHIWTDGAVFDVQGGANYTAAAGDWIRIYATTVSTFEITIFRATDTMATQIASSVVITGGTATLSTLTLNDVGANLLGIGGAPTGDQTANITRGSGVALHVHLVQTSVVEAAIGFKASDSNFYIGSGSSNVGTNGVYLANTATSWTSNSDKRLKTNITPLGVDAGLAAINKLNPVTFNWRNPESSKATQYGLVAQEVQPVFPELVNKGPVSDLAPDGALGVEYTSLIPMLIKSIQELSARVIELESK